MWGPPTQVYAAAITYWSTRCFYRTLTVTPEGKIVNWKLGAQEHFGIFLVGCGLFRAGFSSTAKDELKGLAWVKMTSQEKIMLLSALVWRRSVLALSRSTASESLRQGLYGVLG